MRSRFLLITVGLSLFSLSFVSPILSRVYSQSPSPALIEEFDFSRAYNDYIFIKDKYERAHADYLLARSQYLQAKTLASQTQARDTTVLMLQARDEVVAAYLTALRMRITEASGLDANEKESVFSRIDADVSWYGNHREQISSVGSLADLEADSKEAADHFLLTELLIYEALSIVPIGRLDVLYKDASSILSNIKTKVSQIRANGDHDVSDTERWILDTENKINRSLDKQIEARQVLSTLQTAKSSQGKKKATGLATYDSVISLLSESFLFLREASSYMKETVNIIIFE